MDNSINIDNIPMSKRTPSLDDENNDITNAVKKYIEENPDKYRKAQSFGHFLMSRKFANVDTFKVSEEDDEGNDILYEKLIHDINYYDIKIEELQPYELMIIEKKLGTKWENKIFKN